MNIVIYDTEIKHGVVTEDNPMETYRYRYAKGWTDFAGMGISTLCAYDVLKTRMHVYLDDNLLDFATLVEQRTHVLGFNNHRFDDPLIAAHGIAVDRENSIDLAALIWKAAGIPQGEHPRGLGLDALCKSHGLPIKSARAADAPQLYQDGKIGQVIDYCIGDVHATLQLYRYIANAGGCIDPRNGEWLTVVVPK